MRARPTRQEVEGVEKDVVVPRVRHAEVLKVSRHLLARDPGRHRVLEDRMETEDQLGMGGWGLEGLLLSFEKGHQCTCYRSGRVATMAS